MIGKKQNVDKVGIVADDEAAHALLNYCPDIEDWPKSWSYEESDLAPGQLIVELFKPFLLHLLAKKLATSTLRRHRDHLWMLGGEVIRRRIGFEGLLLTDDLDMAALDGTVPERAERAVVAGCDLALNCWAKMDDMVGIANALPAMSDATAARLQRALAPSADFVRPTDMAPQADLLAKRDALLALVGAGA